MLGTGILLMLVVVELDISLLREYVQHGSGHHSAPLLEICLLKWPVKWQKLNVAIHPVLLGCFTLFPDGWQLQVIVARSEAVFRWGTGDWSETEVMGLRWGRPPHRAVSALHFAFRQLRPEAQLYNGAAFPPIKPAQKQLWLKKGAGSEHECIIFPSHCVLAKLWFFLKQKLTTEKHLLHWVPQITRGKASPGQPAWNPEPEMKHAEQPPSFIANGWR